MSQYSHFLVERVENYKAALESTNIWPLLFEYIENFLFQLVSKVKKFSVEMRTILILDIENIQHCFSMKNEAMQSLIESCWFTEEKMEEWIMNNIENLPKACLLNRLKENSKLTIKFKRKMIKFLS